MSDFIQYLRQISEEFRLLNEDIGKIVAEKKKEAEGKESKKPSLKSIQSVTMMHKSKNEAKNLGTIQSVTKMHKNKTEAENSNKNSGENKEIDFINDRINRIFSK
jgi:hypothetical protein